MRPGDALFKQGAIKPGACASPPWVAARDAIHVAARGEIRLAVVAPDETRAAGKDGIQAQGDSRVAEPGATQGQGDSRCEEPVGPLAWGATPFSAALQGVIRGAVLVW